jgi:hypothetical protein
MSSIMLSWSGNVEYHFELSPLVLAKFNPSSSICDELELELLDDANMEDDDLCVECPNCCLCSEPAEGEQRAFDIIWVRERPCTIMYTIVASLASDAN